MTPTDAPNRLRDLLHRATAVLVLAAPVMYSINLGLTRHKGVAAGPYLTAADILTLILTFIVALAVVLRRDWRSVRFPAAASIAMVVWFALGITRLSADVSVSKGALLKETFQLFEYLCLGYALLVTAMSDRRKIGLFLDALGIATTAVVLFGLVQYLMNNGHVFLLGSTFENNSLLSGWCAISVPLLLGWAFSSASLWRKIWAVALVLGCLPIVMNGWFFLLLGIGIIVLFAQFGELTGLVAVAVVALLFAGALELLPDRNKERIVFTMSLYHQLDNNAARELNKTHAASARLRNWQAALHAAEARPWTGYGASSYASAVKENFFFDPKYTERTDKVEAFDVHVDEPSSFSTYLILLVENGLIGLLLFLGLLVSAIRWAGTAAFAEGSVRFIGRGALASVLVAIVAAHFVNVLERGLAFLFVFVIALSFVLYEQARGYTES